MREELLARFIRNIQRVGNLIALYRAATGTGSGRRALHATDILRSAVVLLHAAMEDVVRGAGLWRLPWQGEEVLNDIPLVGLSPIGRPEKFWLGKLAGHRAKNVQTVIEDSVRAYMATFSINSPTDIVAFMRRIGVDSVPYQQYWADINELVARRHHIVHQADHNERAGVGQHGARTISVAQVERWSRSTETCMQRFLQDIPDDLI